MGRAQPRSNGGSRMIRPGSDAVRGGDVLVDLSQTTPHGDEDIASPFRFRVWGTRRNAPKNEVDTKIALLPLR
jgi:hypothetical protein